MQGKGMNIERVAGQQSTSKTVFTISGLKTTGIKLEKKMKHLL